MKNNSIWLVIAALALFSGCQKQQTEEERKAQIEREVQERLAAEHQAQQREQVAQREANVEAREKALADSQAATANRQPSTPPARPRRDGRSAEERRPAESYNLFYTRLEPYGSWLETRDYGYVWQPRDAGSSSWRPYANGHWVYTDAGWTWVSEEPFGWATYHYGRWTRLRTVGWIWVPGEEWAPAWVSWRKSDDYVGWAPLPPEAQFDRRTGIHNWADNYYDIGPNQYCFVPTSQFGGARVEHTIVPAEQNVTIINQTTNVTHITYNNVTVVNQGPNYDELRGRTQQPIPRLRLERQSNFDPNSRGHEPVVRGEVIEMTAPIVERAQAVERPREVRQTNNQTTVDRGWGESGDTAAARQARAKMKSEATPPSDAPPKTFVRTDARPEGSAASPASPGSTRMEAAAENSAATSSPTPPKQTGEGGPRPTSSPAVTPAPTASPSPALAATSRPTPARTRPRDNPAPLTSTPTASSSVAPTATPQNAVSPQPFASAGNEPPRVGDRLKSQAKRFHPSQIEPMPPPGTRASASPSASLTNRPAPGESAGPSAGPSSPPIYQRPDGMRRRPPVGPRTQPGGPAPEETPGSSASPSPSTGMPPSPQSHGPEQNRRRLRAAQESPSPTVSPAPSATP